jgi:hypothetical protein
LKKPNHLSGLHAFVARGPNTDTLLFPHRHEDGKFVVSPTKLSKDYTRVGDPAEPLHGWRKVIACACPIRTWESRRQA